MSPLPPSISIFILYLSGNFVNRKLEIPSSKIRVVSISNEFFVFHASIILALIYSQLQNENLEQPILELSRRLQNTKGKTVYGYLPPMTCGTRCGKRCAVPTQNNCRSACFFPNRKSSRPCATWSSGRCFSWGGVSIPQQMR